MPHHSKEEVSAREYRDQKNGEQVERNLGEPRMQNEQRVGTVASHSSERATASADRTSSQSKPFTARPASGLACKRVPPQGFRRASEARPLCCPSRAASASPPSPRQRENACRSIARTSLPRPSRRRGRRLRRAQGAQAARSTGEVSGSRAGRTPAAG